MTLDEAILHAEEVAEEKENEGKLLCQSEGASIRCLTCAEEHRQLAEWLKDYKRMIEQEPKTGHYEYHIDHTDCIWYGSGSGCPVTCSQYRDGWNDAMDYIFKNGKGYQPHRHDG